MIEEVERWLTKLLDAYRGIDPYVDVHVEIGEMAQGICSFIADGPTPREIVKVAKALDQLVNVAMPAASAFRAPNEGGATTEWGLLPLFRLDQVDAPSRARQ